MGRTRWFAAESLRTDEDPRTRSVRYLIIEKLPFLALSIASSIATMIAQSAGGAMATTEQIPLSLRIGNALVSYVRYARNFVWPANLSAFYPLLRPWSLACVFAAAILLTAITITFLYLSRRRPHLGFGWLWFLGTLIPVIGLVQVGNQAMADRYMYIPLIGLAIVVAWTGAEIVPKIGRRQCMALASITLMSLAAITAQDVRWWNNSEALFSRAIEQTEPNVFALHNLASALLQRGQTQQAIASFQQCTALQPGNPHVRRALGFAYKEAKRYDDAIAQLKVAVRIDPKEARTWNTLGHVYADQQKWSAAADHFAVACELNRDDYDSRINLAIAHRQNNQPQLALADLQTASRLSPNEAKPWYLYGSLLLETNRPADAIEPLHRATVIDPRFADAHYRLGLALMQSGHGAQSVGPLMTAVELSPNSPDPLAKLAWVLSTYPDAKLRRGNDALFLAQRASSLSKSSPQVLSTLAAALAEEKQFPDAAKIATDAAELAEAAGDTVLAEKLQTTAADYRAGRATRDPTLAGADTGDAIP